MKFKIYLPKFPTVRYNVICGLFGSDLKFVSITKFNNRNQFAVQWINALYYWCYYTVVAY